MSKFENQAVEMNSEYRLAKLRNGRFTRYIAWVTILVQIFLPLSLTFSSVHADLTENDPDGQYLYQGLDINEFAKGKVKGYITKETEVWLEQYGTTEAKINIDDEGNLAGSHIDMLLGLDEDEDGLFFTQFGARYSNVDYDKVTANFGLGYRDYDDIRSTTGYNAFIDHQFQNSHTRLGLGLEYHREFLRMMGNGYIGLTDWKNSDYLAGYEEKPANGFDLRLDGYLPDHPELGAKLKYEHYFGDEVALFNVKDRSRNPYAFTIGLNYTPVPLFSFGVDHREGSHNQRDTQFFISLNYAMGVPLETQLENDNVAGMRSVVGQRHSLVQRNNEIVLKYRKAERPQTVVTPAPENIGLVPEVISGGVADGLTPGFFAATVFDRNTNPIKNAKVLVMLADSDPTACFLPINEEDVCPQEGRVFETFTDEEGRLLPPDNMAVAGNHREFLLPVFSRTARTVPINLELVETGEIKPVKVPFGDIRLELNIDTDIVKIANGQDENPVTIEVSRANGEKLDEGEVTVTLKLPADKNVCFNPINTRNDKCEKTREVTPDASGDIPPIPTYSLDAGAFEITAEINDEKNQLRVSGEVNFKADASNVEIVITVNQDPIIADGDTPNNLVVDLHDPNNNPIVDEKVRVTLPDDLNVCFNPINTTDPSFSCEKVKEVQTGSDGKTPELPIYSTEPGTPSIKIEVPDLGIPPVNETITFVPDSDNAILTITTEPGGISANGKTPNPVDISLKDPLGNPIAEQEITLTLPDNFAVCFNDVVTNAGESCLKTKIVKTGPDGVIEDIPTYSTEIGEVMITAKTPINEGLTDEGKLTFIEPTLKITLTPSDAVIADGETPNRVAIEVKDSDGNRVDTGTKIIVTLDPNQGACFAPLALPTDTCAEEDLTREQTVKSDGSVDPLDVFSRQANDPIISAIVKDKPLTKVEKPVPFINRYTIEAIEPNPHDGAIAEGTQRNTVSFVVKDQNGQVASDQSVIITNDTVRFCESAAPSVCAINETLTLTTNSDGIITVDMASIVGGEFPIVATLENADVEDATGQSATTNVTFADLVTLSLALDGSDTAFAMPAAYQGDRAAGNVKFNGQLKDQNDIPLVGVTITLKADNMDVALCQAVDTGCGVKGSTITVVTDANGNYSFIANSVSVGDANISAYIADPTDPAQSILNSDPEKIEAHFIADISTATFITVSRSSTNSKAGSKLFNGYYAEVKDQYNNPVPNARVQVTLGAEAEDIQMIEFLSSKTPLDVKAAFQDPVENPTIIADGIYTTLSEGTQIGFVGFGFISEVVQFDVPLTFTLLDSNAANKSVVRDGSSGLTFTPNPETVTLTVSATPSMTPVYGGELNSGGGYYDVVYELQYTDARRTGPYPGAVLTAVSAKELAGLLFNDGKTSAQLTNAMRTTDVNGQLKLKVQGNPGVYQVAFKEAVSGTNQSANTQLEFIPNFGNFTVTVGNSEVAAPAGEHSFLLGEGPTGSAKFPTQGYENASFEINWPEGQKINLAEYVIEVSSDVVDFSNNLVTLYSDPGATPVTITAKLKDITGNTSGDEAFIFTYEFTVSRWYEFAQNAGNFNTTEGSCQTAGLQIAQLNDLLGTPGVRGVGALWNEYGVLATESAGASTNQAFTNNESVVVDFDTGTVPTEIENEGAGFCVAR